MRASFYSTSGCNGEVRGSVLVRRRLTQHGIGERRAPTVAVRALMFDIRAERRQLKPVRDKPEINALLSQQASTTNLRSQPANKPADR